MEAVAVETLALDDIALALVADNPLAEVLVEIRLDLVVLAVDSLVVLVSLKRLNSFKVKIN